MSRGKSAHATSPHCLSHLVPCWTSVTKLDLTSTPSQSSPLCLVLHCPPPTTRPDPLQDAAPGPQPAAGLG